MYTSCKCTWNVSLAWYCLSLKISCSFLLESHCWPRYRYQYRCNQWNQPSFLSYFWHRPASTTLCVWVYKCMLSDQLRYGVYFSYREIWCFCSNHSLIDDPHFDSRNWLHFRVGSRVLSRWFVCLWLEIHPRFERTYKSCSHIHRAFSSSSPR